MGTRNKPRGVIAKLMHDPNWRFVTLPDGDMAAYYKGKRVDYDKDAIDAMEERAHRLSRGQDPDPITIRRS